ncbi:hypothetical protein [Sphingomonas sanxanigenens]|uniref:HTH iclR-type domain-containing protein n=1 Tax=Sphingomonas sanxanigenens DSM 19645 = NX02 TaxID=1123269 RepID=W0AAB9_9SPHN|nr:hypothetical protein [Sphingomonas sanxanigenens]AHE52600.1 hypothetical protein NX02_04260 [Sphingomonas sanxanigenens DSM 19645 = NX02]AHE56043.1 hypothetical protein NX02_22085 [Sphingomonas sanxanigenens DSM 19645 = NX02]
MTDLLRQAPAPGASARDTSRAAAADIAPRAKIFRDRALAALEASNGLTADEVAGKVGLPVLSIRPRITELFALGLIRDTHERRANASGRKAIVWAAIQPAGQKRARA